MPGLTGLSRPLTEDRMRRPTLAFLAAVALLLTLTSPRWPLHAQEEAPQGEPTRSPEEIAAERDSLMHLVLEEIKGKEELPADSVFKNLKFLGQIPAGRLPRIMNMGFGRSLGVSCNFCHAPGDYASDENPHKEVARRMMQMVQTINNDHLWKIEDLMEGKTPEERPTANCTMCHRGEKEPSQTLVTPLSK